MKIEPYVRVGSLQFGVSREAIVAALGKPVSERANRKGGLELEYSAAIYRLDNDSLIEASIDAPVVILGSVAVPFQTLSAFVSEHDKEAFDCIGFVVSPAHGVAFDPKYPSWVTAFPQKELAEWQRIARR